MAISITKPTVGGSQDTWGEVLNNSLDVIVDGINGTSGTVSPDLTALKINGTTVTATPTELNIMDGNTSATSTSVTGTDAIVYNDNGVMKQVTLNDINAFIQAQSGSAGNGQITITAGSALTGGGNFTVNQAGNTTVTVNHEDTSSQGSSNNSGNTFIQDITLDNFGHITGLGTGAVTSGGVSVLATGTQSVGSSGGGLFTIATGASYANKTYITMVISNINRLANGGFDVGTTNGSGTISGQVISIGNPFTYTIKWAVLG
jgi:hypothetical protein